jgi:hypothetical protein
MSNTVYGALLRSIYLNPRDPASFGSIHNLYKSAKKQNPNITLNIVRNWLLGQDVYTLHGLTRRNFLRRKTLSKGLYYQMQIDLVDVSNIKNKNKNYTFLLTAIDIFSRKAFAIPVKSKHGPVIVEAMKQIFKEYPRVTFIQADHGVEFFNKDFKKYLQGKNIKLFYTSSDTKASIVERFNRTLKNRMFKYFTAYNTRSYLPILNDLVDAYNNTRHRSIGIAPNKVTKENEKKVWNFQYKEYFKKYAGIKFKLELHDTVRISKLSKLFRKGYLPSFQEEYFKIYDRMSTVPPTYKLLDMNGEVLRGIFYEQELQKVIPERDQYKVLKTRTRKGIKEHLVHYIGHPSNFDTWILNRDLKQ